MDSNLDPSGRSEHGLLRLPAEVRVRIWQYVLEDAIPVPHFCHTGSAKPHGPAKLQVDMTLGNCPGGDDDDRFVFAPLLPVNKQVYRECIAVAYTGKILSFCSWRCLVRCVQQRTWFKTLLMEGAIAEFDHVHVRRSRIDVLRGAVEGRDVYQKELQPYVDALLGRRWILDVPYSFEVVACDFGSLQDLMVRGRIQRKRR